jgi:phosphoglycerate kinase
VLGGAKVSDKIDVVEALLKVVDTLWRSAARWPTPSSPRRGRRWPRAASRRTSSRSRAPSSTKARDKNVEMLLPVDVIVAKGLDATSGQAVSVDAIPEGTMALDIGPKSIALFGKQITMAKTVFWNGPMGLFETPPSRRAPSRSPRHEQGVSGFTVVGGGDSASAVKQAGEDDRQGLQAHLDGRRRLARAHRGQEASPEWRRCANQRRVIGA